MGAISKIASERKSQLGSLRAEADRIIATGEYSLSADFIEKNKRDLALRYGTTLLKRVSAEAKIESEITDLRRKFYNPESRLNDRSNLFAQSSKPRTTASSLFEQAARTRRQRKNEGTSLSASDALGL